MTFLLLVAFQLGGARAPWAPPGYAYVPGAMTRRSAPPTRYTLQRITASIMKEVSTRTKMFRPILLATESASARA